MSIQSLKNKSNLTIDEINLLMKKETDIKIYKKLNFLKLKLMGYSTKEAYELANIKKSLAYLTLDQWKLGGYNELLRKKGGGRNIKLNNDQLNELKIRIMSNEFQDESDIQKFIKTEWNEEYTMPGIKNLLKTQFKINLNENNETINELLTKLEIHLKDVENINLEKDDEINRLKLLISREKNAEVLKKLIYVLFRRIGFSNRFTSKLLSITTATGNNWINNWKKYGYKGLIRKKGQGRKTKLTNDEIERLKKN